MKKVLTINLVKQVRNLKHTSLKWKRRKRIQRSKKAAGLGGRGSHRSKNKESLRLGTTHLLLDLDSMGLEYPSPSGHSDPL